MLIKSAPSTLVTTENELENDVLVGQYGYRVKTAVQAGGCNSTDKCPSGSTWTGTSCSASACSEGRDRP